MSMQVYRFPSESDLLYQLNNKMKISSTHEKKIIEVVAKKFAYIQMTDCENLSEEVWDLLSSLEIQCERFDVFSQKVIDILQNCVEEDVEPLLIGRPGPMYFLAKL